MKTLRLMLVVALLGALPLSAQQLPTLEKVYGWMKASLPPQTPVLLSPALGAVDQALPITLTWEAVGADSVDVRLGTTTAPSTIAVGVTQSSYPLTGLQAGRKYYWQIIARNAKGAKNSIVSNFTTLADAQPPAPVPTSLPVVPGGQGYGMASRAAYGCSSLPTILRVTTLTDGGAGSLRAAMEATMPRVVVFEVAGYFDLNDTIRVTSPCLTTAGQTAPSPGVTLRKYGLEIQTHDVLLQHFRVRPGEWGQGKADNCAIIAWGAQAHDIVLDHMSVSWGPDENIAADTYYAGDMNMAVWRSITAESLDYPPSVPSSAGHGLLVMAKSKRVSVAQTLFVGNRERNPYAQSDTSLAAVNNLIFNAFANWHFFFANFDLSGNPGAGGPWAASVVGNRIIAGPNTDDDPGSPQGWAFYYNKPGASVAGNQIYRADNTIDNAQGFAFDACDATPAGSSCNELPYDPTVNSPPVAAPITAFAPIPSTSVEATILAHAGARPLERDAIDARIVNDVVTRRGRGYFKNQSTVGGYPAVASTSRPLVVPLNPHVVSASGYTTLELWLQNYATSVGE